MIFEGCRVFNVGEVDNQRMKSRMRLDPGLLSSTSTIHSGLANPDAPPKYSLLVAVVVVELAFFQSP